MALVRLPRFKRASQIAPIQLTDRDRTIIRLVHRHRFLRSNHIRALIAESPQQILRRLQLLYHHGYLERPYAQIDYYRQGGSRKLVYGLGSKAAALLKRDSPLETRELDWTRKNRGVRRIFLEHALQISEVMVALELGCRRSGRVRLLMRDQLPLPDELKRRREPFRWRVQINHQLELGLIPDEVFALEFADKPVGSNRAFFFLEADRATMPAVRSDLSHTSFFRKLLAYQATWRQNIHRSRFGFHRFRVITVTSSPHRVDSLVAACERLDRGHGLFLFTDRHSLADDDPLHRCA